MRAAVLVVNSDIASCREPDTDRGTISQLVAGLPAALVAYEVVHDN